MTFDGAGFGREIVAEVRDYVERATDPIWRELGALPPLQALVAEVKQQCDARLAEMECRDAARAAEIEPLRAKAAEADALRAKVAEIVHEHVEGATGALRDAQAEMER